jgi:hypothetical protein
LLTTAKEILSEKTNHLSLLPVAVILMECDVSEAGSASLLKVKMGRSTWSGRKGPLDRTTLIH